MARLAKALVGAWTTTETMEKSPLFPEGASRRGEAAFRLGPGGTTLVEEGHSDGSAGPLSFLIVFWWDAEARTYRLLTCFKAQGQGCEVRGTARFEGDTFVNDYEDVIGGRRLPFRDSFFPPTGDAFTLVEAVIEEGRARALITTTYKRESPRSSS
jgi:hypothetical protein